MQQASPSILLCCTRLVSPPSCPPAHPATQAPHVLAPPLQTQALKRKMTLPRLMIPWRLDDVKRLVLSTLLAKKVGVLHLMTLEGGGCRGGGGGGGGGGAVVVVGWGGERLAGCCIFPMGGGGEEEAEPRWRQGRRAGRQGASCRELDLVT